ncbi:hypothetical protein [Nitrosophilus kaiyonis]|uniref:hypothetical protein n=1 Tax=Nitrosophilus kaiyonis TaxID=2930200 RepID=UPI00248F76A4|nr:hypothetical protein [Nitrosophilus kaiyonis]
MKIFIFIFLIFTVVYSQEVKCTIEYERIYCKYFIDRSDNENGKRVLFHWHSPSGKDDRKRVFEIPPYYGSVYDYRYLPGRENGKWIVEVKDLDTNESAETSFIVNSENEEFFEE